MAAPVQELRDDGTAQCGRCSRSLRDDLYDSEGCRPLELRTNLLKLHELALSVVNNGARRQASEMFDLAMDLDEQVSHMMNELEQIQDMLVKLVALHPKSLSCRSG